MNKLAIGFMAVLAAGPVGAETLSSIYGHYDYTHFGVDSATAAVSYGSYPTTPQAGFADASSLTAKAYTSLLSTSGAKTAYIESEVRNTLYLGAGTSGLSFGTPVSIQLSLSLDGKLRAGTTTPPAGTVAFMDPAGGVRQLSSAEMWASFSIYDPSQLVGGGPEDDPSPLRLMRFGASGDLMVDSMSWNRVQSIYATYYPWWIAMYDPANDGFTDVSEDFSWNYESNSGDSDEFSYDYYSNLAGTLFNPFYNDTYLFDTGTLSIEFDSYVGAELDVSGSLSFFLQADASGLDSLAMGDFMNTLSAHFTSETQGLQLSLGAAPPPIPEPETWALMLAGLGLMGFMARRRAGSIRAV